MKSWIKRKVLDPVLALLRQGITPEKIALSTGWGFALGIFPVLGSTTILCTIAAMGLRLNLPAIQLINWLVYPLQIALLIPFFRCGEWIFRAPRLYISPTRLVEMFRADFWGSILALWDTTVHAVVAWCAFAPLMIAGIYFLLLPLLRRMPMPRTAEPNQGEIS